MSNSAIKSYRITNVSMSSFSMRKDSGPGGPATLTEAVKLIDSSDPSDIIHGLNLVTLKSFNRSTETCDINLESCPYLLLSLGSLLDVVNPIGNILFMADTAPKILARFGGDDDTYWTSELPSHNQEAFQVYGDGFYCRIIFG